MSNFAADLVVLFAGAGLTLTIGLLLLRAGRPYLEQVFSEVRVAASVDRLLTVLYLLVTLGFVALVTALDLGIDGTYKRILVKLGLVLLIIGATYGLMMFVVSQIRARRKQEQISDEISMQIMRQQAGYDPLRPIAEQSPPAPVQQPAPEAPDPQQAAPAQVPEEPPPGGYATPPARPTLPR